MFRRRDALLLLCLGSSVAPAPGRGAEPGGVDEVFGHAVYAIPLVSPPGAASHGPDLALLYRSGAARGGAGWLGFGWELSGTSAIERDRKRGVPYDYQRPHCGSGGDRFCYRERFVLDGEDLVCAESPCGAVYKTRRDDGRRIEYLGAPGGWSIRDRDGRTYRYGTEPASRIANDRNGEVFSWLLERVEDAHGNWIEYHYDLSSSPGVAYLVSVRYAQAGAAANRELVFVTSPRADRAISYRAGFRQQVDRRLTRIDVRAGAGALVTRYELGYAYSPDSGRSLLVRVQRVGADGETALPPHRFAYTESRRAFERDASPFCMPDGWPCADMGLFEGTFPNDVLADVNRDGLVDAYGASDVCDASGSDQTRVRLGNGSWASSKASAVEWFPACGLKFLDGDDVEPFPFVDSVVMDLDADGYPDWAGRKRRTDTSGARYEGVYLGSDTGYLEPALAYDLPDSRPGWISHGSLGAPPWFFFGLWWGWSKNPDYPVNYERLLHKQLIDMTGDRRPDLVYAKHPSSVWVDSDGDVPTTPSWLVYPNLGISLDGSALAWSENFIDWADPFEAPLELDRVSGSYQENRLLTLDLNADGLPDRLLWYGIGDLSHRVRIAYGYGAGFDAPEVYFEGAAEDFFWGRYQAASCVTNGFADLNGDGFPDHVISLLSYDFEGDPDLDPWMVRFGTGSGMPSAFERWGGTTQEWWDREHPYACVSAAGVNSPWHEALADLNGDGLLDRYGHHVGLVYLNQGPVPDLLRRAVRPRGGSIAFEYGFSAQEQDAEGAPANPGLAPTRPVVERLTSADGRPGTPDVVSRFHYADGVFDYEANAFRGFGTVTRVDLEVGDPGGPEGSEIVSTYNTDRACARTLARREIRHGAALLRSEAYRYLRLSGPAVAELPAGATWDACLLHEAVEISVEGEPDAERVRRTVWEYGPDPIASHYNVQRAEEWGEVLADGTDVPGDERFTLFAYATPTAADSPVVSRISALVVIEGPGSPIALSIWRILYDGLPPGRVSAGRPTRIEEWHRDPEHPGADRWVATSSTDYDAYGNPVRVRRAPTESNARGLGVETTYDEGYATFVAATTLGPDSGHALTTRTRYTGCAEGREPPPGLGLPCGRVDASGGVERWAYDALGRVARVHHQSGLVEIRRYALPDATGPAETILTTEFELPDGTRLRYRDFRDGLGRSHAEESPGKSAETIRVERTHDDRGRLATETLPHFVGAGTPPVRSFAYDPLGRLREVIDFDGETHRVWRHEPWRVIEEVHFGDPALPVRRQERAQDGRGRTVEVASYEDPVALETRLAIRSGYDALDRLIWVDDPIASDPALCRLLPEGAPCESQSHRTELVYDSLGRRVRLEDPDAGTWRFRYDDAGNLLERGDGAGRSQHFEYDALGRLIGRRFEPEGSGAYDAHFAYQNDPAQPDYARLVAVETQAAEGTSYAYAYDAAGRLESVVQATAGRVFPTRFRYDELSRVAERVFPDGEVFRYRYDGARLTGIEGDGLRVLAGAEYDALGRTRELRLGTSPEGGAPVAVLARRYDPETGRLERMTADGRGSGTPAPDLDLALAFDGLGRLTHQEGSYGATPLGARDFAYDGLGRLRGAVGLWERDRWNPDPVTWSFAYDPLGNPRAQASSSRTYERTWRYEHGQKPRFLTELVEPGRAHAMTSDPGGNPTRVGSRRVVWNAQNRVHRMPPWGSSGLFYDAFDRRTLRNIGTLTRVVYVGEDFEYDTRLQQANKFFFVNGERVATRATVYDPSRGSPAVEGAGGPSWFGSHRERLLIYAADHLGSTRVVIDGSGETVETRDYTPFGRTIAHSGAFVLKHQFTGRPSFVGSHRYGARMYDPTWARFVSPDERLQSLDSQGMNPYAYALNAPTSRVDASGTLAQVPAAVAVAIFSAAGAAAIEFSQYVGLLPRYGWWDAAKTGLFAAHTFATVISLPPMAPVSVHYVAIGAHGLADALFLGSVATAAGIGPPVGPARGPAGTELWKVGGGPWFALDSPPGRGAPGADFVEAQRPSAHSPLVRAESSANGTVLYHHADGSTSTAFSDSRSTTYWSRPPRAGGQGSPVGRNHAHQDALFYFNTGIWLAVGGL